MAETEANALTDEGWLVVDSLLGGDSLEALREGAFAPGVAGKRCLLDEPAVRQTAVALKGTLTARGLLPAHAVAIQAIAFDKSPGSNWKVTWHQDLMFPVAGAGAGGGFELPTVKDGVSYARPPRAVLEDMLAVRLHLDDCDSANGPLRVAPRSHQDGVLPATAIQEAVARRGEVTCLAAAGQVLLMRPLLLHASSPASVPRRRRVLHVVYHSGPGVAGVWHRRV